MAEVQDLRNGAWWHSYWTNFLGGAPAWYKGAIVAFLIVNPFLYSAFGGFIAGWVLVLEFIFTLAMALRCYPLQPGGLLAIEALVIGMTSPEHVFHEVEVNLPVILLLMFMVAGIFFMKDLLLFTFTKILVGVRNKLLLAVLFSFVAAILSAFLDALTVMAVVISVAAGFYRVYYDVVFERAIDRLEEAVREGDEEVPELANEDIDRFRAFLRSLVMHAAVGHGFGRRDDHRRRASKRAHRHAYGLGVHRVLSPHGAGDAAGIGRWPGHMPGA